jgi:hypothetical protein
MKLAALHLRQRDGVTCGPTVALVAGALVDPARRAALLEPDAHAVSPAGLAWFSTEQGRIHAQTNLIWPRRLGTTPMGMAWAMTAETAAFGLRYRWRPFRGRRDRLADVWHAVASGTPVAMLIGAVVPRHWVLLVDTDGDAFQCYEPSSGAVLTVEPGDIRAARLRGLGFARPFAFVLPR